MARAGCRATSAHETGGHGGEPWVAAAHGRRGCLSGVVHVPENKSGFGDNHGRLDTQAPGEYFSVMELRGKVAVITGASRGIGAGLAREFAARGMKLGLCARGACEVPAGAEGFTARVDVAEEHQVSAFAEEAARHLGTIDLWINNAGVLEPIGPLRQVTAEAFMHSLRVNVMGVVHGSQAYIDHVRASHAQGVLMNISSGAAWKGYPGWAAYCAGKAAVERISETIQLEEEAHMRVYAVAPGVVDTAMQELIRACTPEQFPYVERFREMKAKNAFNTIPHVAEHLLRMAFDPAARPEAVTAQVPSQHG